MSRPDIEGAFVTFYFESQGPLCGTVEWSPAATGDCWIIRNEELTQHRRYYIQQFAYMRVHDES